MLPKTGRRFPSGNCFFSEIEYVKGVSDALRSELGTTRAAAKIIVHWTRTSDRTARNWLNGVVGPSGHHLVCLMRESDAVLSAVLEMSGRPGLVVLAELDRLEATLASASDALRTLRGAR